ncbi:hypothetical protein, partial [Amycolatopsis japonica]
VVKLDAFGVYRLLRGLALLSGRAWRDLPDVTIVSCWVDTPATGGLLGTVRELATKDGHRGTVSGNKGRARVRKGVPRIEELAGEPSGPVTGGVGFDENGVPYVDLAPPDWQGPEWPPGGSEFSLDSSGTDHSLDTPSLPWSTDEQLMAGSSWDDGDSLFEDFARFSPVEGNPGVGGYVSDSLLGNGLSDSVVSWRGELGPGVGVVGGWPTEAEAELVGLVEVFVRNSVVLAGQGREPLDVVLVTRGVAGGGWAWQALLEERLKTGLRNAGLNPDTAPFFDRVGSGVADGEVPSVGVVVRESPNRQVSGYKRARTLTLSFLPGNAEVTQASRRRLGWLAQGLVLRWVGGVESRLVVDVSDAAMGLVSEEVKAAVREAARPWASDETVASFADTHVEFRVTAETVVVLRIEGPEHELDSIHVDPDLHLSWNEQIPAAQQQNQPSRAAVKRKATEPLSSPETPIPAIASDPDVAPGPDTVFELPAAERLNSRTRVVAPDAAEVARWSVKPPKWAVEPSKLVDSELSSEAKAGLGALADRLLGEFAPVKGGVPWDIRLHVTETAFRLENKYDEAWFKLMERELESALKARKADEGLLWFDFDHIAHRIQSGKPASLDLVVHDTAGQTIQEYQDAQSMGLFFLPFGDLTAASRRKLHWRVRRLAEIAEENAGDQRRLVLDLRSPESLRRRRVETVTREVNKAVRTAYPGKTGQEIKAFIDKYIGLASGVSSNSFLFVALTRLPTGQGVVAEPSAGDLPSGVRQSWESHVTRARKAARGRKEPQVVQVEPDDLVELTVADRPVRAALRTGKGGFDVPEAARWSATPSQSGSPELSDADMKRMGAFAESFLRHVPEAKGELWDIRLHVTDTQARLKHHGQAWFELLEMAFKATLAARGIREDSERLLFGFDHIEHRPQGKAPSVDIVVYKTSVKMIQDYQQAQELDLDFLPRGDDLLKASRRKLHWRVEGLAKIVEADSSDRSRLVLDLHSREGTSSGRLKAVTQAVNTAVRRAYPRASRMEVKTFIDKRIEIICRDSKKRAAGLFVDVVNYPEKAAFGTLSLQQLASLKNGKSGHFAWVSPDHVQMSPDHEEEIRYFGDLLGQKILTRPHELPDVRITVNLNSGFGDDNVRQAVQKHLAGLLWEGMSRARLVEYDASLTEFEIEGFAFTWLWRQESRSYEGQVFVRARFQAGEPVGGRPSEYYRQAKKLKGMFLSGNSAQLPKPVERRVALVTEGFFGRFIAGERSILTIEIKGNSRTGLLREKRMKDVVREALVALGEGIAVPTVEHIMRDYVQIAWDPQWTLTNAEFLIQELDPVEHNVRGPVLPSSGVPAVLLSEVVVGGVDVGDVECVV